MAITTTISSKELKRQAAACFEGKALRVMLCLKSTSGYTAESSVSNWQAQEVLSSGTGYVRFSATLGTSTYNPVTTRQEIPPVDAVFNCINPYSYDTVVVYFNNEFYVHSLITESPNITLMPGQTQTYRITFSQDDA